MEASNVNPQNNPSMGFEKIRGCETGVHHDKQRLIIDPAIHTGWNRRGGSPRNLSHVTAATSNFPLALNGSKYVTNTKQRPIDVTDSGGLGTGTMGFRGM